MGLIRGMAKTAVVAGTATAVSNRVSRRQQNRWSNDNQQAEAEQAQAAPVDDTTAQLQELAQLRNQGILSEEEFGAKKKQILGI